MAYDGYRGPSDDEPSHYASYDARERDAPHYLPSDSGTGYTRPRSRASSRGARSDTANQPQPIHDAANAVNYAFDRSDAASHVDPKLIAQITEQVRKQVIESLKTSGIAGQPPTAPAPNLFPVDSYPPRTVYTPPSPTRHTYSSNASNASDSPRTRTTFDGHNDSVPSRFDNIGRTMSNTSSQVGTDPTMRPVTAKKVPEDEEGLEDSVERAWKLLFDEYQRPTVRLGQFLRGIAVHLIDNYEPKKNLVVTPAKMLRFYEETAVGNEVFPWSKIFGKLPNTSISKMYRDMRCQHHLTQDIDQYEKAPQIPGLTPLGFQRWMEGLILAYPEIEFQRLAKAVEAMPISSADDPTFRWPKVLPRRLFPTTGDIQAQQRCYAALACDGKVSLPKPSCFPPPPPPPVQPQPTQTFERERNPYSGGPEYSASVSSEDDTPVSVPIERERKPYTAKEGLGKTYEDTANGDRLHRSQSSASQPSSFPAGRNNTTEYTNPAHRHYRTDSINSGRRRSPSFPVGSAGAGYGTRSDGSINDINPGQYASNIYDYDERYRDGEAKRADWVRRQAEEDLGRSYPPGPRTVYDDDQHYRGRGMSNSHGSSNYNPPYSQPPPSRY